MSNHSTNRRINLFHQQKADGKERKAMREAVRFDCFIAGRMLAPQPEVNTFKINDFMSTAWYALTIWIIITGGWFIGG